MMNITCFAQINFEVGIPFTPNVIALGQDGLRATGVYCKVGYEINKFNSSLLVILPPSSTDVYEKGLGLDVNYTLGLNKIQRIKFYPTVQLIYSRKNQNNPQKFENYNLLSGNLGMGIGYKVNQQIHLVSLTTLGFGRQVFEDRKRTITTAPFLLSVGLNFKLKKQTK
jgi:hypothetical protein